MFNDFGILFLSLTVIANLFIAFIVFKANRTSATNILLSILTIDLMLWTVCNFVALMPGSESSRLFWVRTVMFVTTPFGPLIYLLASVFPNDKFDISRWKIGLISTLVILSLAFSYTPYMFSSLSNSDDGGFSLSTAPAIAIYGVNLIGFLTAGFVILIKKYRHNQGIVKKQFGLFLFGTAASFTLMTLTNFVAVVVFDSIKLTYLGPPSTLIMIGFITYAIVKHGLFNLKIVATQALVVVIWIILFSKVFAATTFTEVLTDLFIFILTVIFGILLIVSVRREIQQRELLEKLNQRLKDLDKQKDEFLSMAAHELRAPMTAIKGYISMIVEGDAGEIPEKARGYLADAGSVTDRLVRLVNNMLNVSRIEEGRLVYQVEKENLSVPVQSVFSQFRPEAERKNLEYTLDIPRDIKDKVEVDPDRVQEVIGNLVSNAIKYTEKGFVKLSLSQPDPSKVRFEVTDSGPGISEEERQKLFGKFYRAESSVGKTTGTGLGLYISKLLAEKFGGSIGVNSELGKGSTFWVELPVLTS